MMDSLLQSSSLSFSMSSLVCEALECEKEMTRSWLRSEMNSLVDPLIESLFCKLADKLNTSLRVYNGTYPSYHQGDQGQHQLLYHLNPIPIATSTLQSIIGFFNQIPSIQDRTTNFKCSSIDPIERQFTSTVNAVSLNKDIFEPLVQIKQETTDDEHNITELKAQILKSPSKFSEAFEEEDVEVENEEEEECDCDDCLNGGIIDEVKCEEGDHNDEVDEVEVQVIDDDEPSKPKRPRLDPAVRVNHRTTVENQIIAHSLKCLQVDCYKMFVHKDQMYQHLKLVHQIGRYRCLVKGCHGSFDRNCDLGQHMKDVHSQLAKFACSQCSKNFRTYHLLFKHKSNLHFLGHFQCSFPSCTFVDKTRVRVFGHYSRAHKYSLVCSQCPYRTLNATKLKAHERGHAGIEPYRCKWPGCSGYAHASRDAALAHIRSVHLNAKKMGLLYGQGATAVAADPRDYLEVVKELIN